MQSFRSLFAFNTEWLKLVLEPLARLCIRNFLCIQDIISLVKETLVKAAVMELNAGDHKASVSRISVVTGIHRNEVKNILSRTAAGASGGAPSSSLLTKVTGQWAQDPRFLSSAGKPRILGITGNNNEFTKLVRTVDKNYNPRTILLELKRIGVVEETPRGLKLLQFVSRFTKDYKLGCEILSEDVDTLVKAVEENLLEANPIRNLHITTEYDNIFEDHIEEVRNWLFEEGAAFHKRARDFLSKFDKDINPSAGKKGGIKVKVTAFSLVTKPTE